MKYCLMLIDIESFAAKEDAHIKCGQDEKGKNLE
jgi:hypothetical protein